MVTPILPLYAKALTGSAASAVLMFAFRDVVQIFTRIPSGSLSDRIGRKPVVLLGVTCLTLTQLLYYLSRDPLSLVGAVVLQGIGLGFFLPSSQSMISEMAPEGKVGETMGYRSMTMGFQALIAPLAGGLLAEFFPTYRPIFLITCGLSLLGSVLIASLLPETNLQRPENGLLVELKRAGKEIAKIPRTLKRVFGSKQALSSSIAIFFHGFINGPFNSYFTIYASETGLSESMIGSCFTARSLPTFITPLLGRISDRTGRLIPTLTGLISYLTFLVLIPSANRYLLLLLLFAGLGVSRRLISVSTMAGVAEGTDSGERGAGLGVWGTMLRLGMTIGSLTMGAFVALFPLSWVFYVAASIALLGTILVFLTGRRR